MSEAESAFIRARLQGRLLARATRGELTLRLPTGLVHDPHGDVVLDPDRGVRSVNARLFTTFEATGSAPATVKAFNAEALPSFGCAGGLPANQAPSTSVLYRLQGQVLLPALEDADDLAVNANQYEVRHYSPDSDRLPSHNPTPSASDANNSLTIF